MKENRMEQTEHIKQYPEVNIFKPYAYMCNAFGMQCYHFHHRHSHLSGIIEAC
jgi:hypothetical protein